MEIEKKISEESEKVNPIRDKNIENLSKIQRLNLELQGLDKENTRIQDEIENIKKTLQTLDDDINREFEDFTFNNDGTKIFAIDDDGGMNIHTLSTAYDLTSATQVTDDGINWSTYLVPFLDKIATGVMHPNTIRFNNDGTKMYLSHAVINCMT